VPKAPSCSALPRSYLAAASALISAYRCAVAMSSSVSPARMRARPEFRLGIVEIGRGSAVTGGYRPAAEIAIPCSLRLAGRRADGAHDTADGEAAPDHKEVVIATDAADHANLISRAGTVPTEFAQWAFYGTLARRARRRSYLAVPSMFIWQPMLMRESAALV
jgi:hypothetical protein